MIHPGEFVLGSTVEWVELPDDIVARIEGKSSLGRLGLIVHATAGFVDPGFSGTLTLEITNLDARPDHPLARQADRAAVLHGPRPGGRAALRPPGTRKPLPRPAGGRRTSRYEGGPADASGAKPGNSMNFLSSSSPHFRYREQRMREMESNGEQTHFTKRVHASER